MTYGFAATRMRALQSLASRKRYDLSIGVQSAFTLIYTVELVYYFVRLRSLAGARPAAWRTTAMFILLIMDVVLIWLTIRSKSSAARASSGQQQPRVSAGEPAYAHRANSDVQLDSVNHENPFADEMGPYIPDSHYTAGLQNPRAPEPILGPNGAYPALSTYGEPARSHLNTPITQ